MSAKMGIIQIGTQFLQEADNDMVNLLLDNFRVIDHRSNPCGVISILCISDYFKPVEPDEEVELYHVDLKLDELRKPYIWRVERNDL